MQALQETGLVVGVLLSAAVPVAAQPVGALAIDELQGDQYGWAVDDATAGAAQRAVAECGEGCSVVPFERCAAYASDQEVGSTVSGGADGMFGPGAQSAIRSWQTSRGARATGYPDAASLASLRPSVAGQPRFREREPAGVAASPSGPPAVSAAQQPSPPASAPRRVGDVFRDCEACPEMVVLSGVGLAMGRYEVTVGEYRTFVSATGRTGDDRWRDHDGFPQTDRHPVVYVSWDDAQAYVVWLSRTTGATYRLPTETVWERAAAGSPPGVGCAFDNAGFGACPVGSFGANPAGLSDMLGNAWEWTSDCWEDDCGGRVLLGGSWFDLAGTLQLGARFGYTTAARYHDLGFRVVRTLD